MREKKKTTGKEKEDGFYVSFRKKKGLFINKLAKLSFQKKRGEKGRISHKFPIR